MKLLVSKHGAIYFANNTEFKSHKSKCKQIQSVVLYDAILLRRAKQAVTYKTIYISKKNIVAIVELPKEYLPLDISNPDKLYNRIHTLITKSSFYERVKDMPKLIPIEEEVN